MRIDLNADLGEGYPNDDALLDVVSSANVACGWHAGDAATIEATIRSAGVRGVAVGAHPSYPDRINFGRRPMERTPAQIYDDVLEQLQFFSKIASACGARVGHVKAHGALYNHAAKDRPAADALSAAVAAFDPHVAIFGLAGGEQIASARRARLRAVEEVFADRGYARDGSLLSRDEPGALVEDPAGAARAALSFVERGVGETICIHGDGPSAVRMAREIRRALTEAGVEIRSVL